MSGTTTTITTQLRDAIALRCPGADFALIDDEIRWTLYDFLHRTLLLRETLSVPLVAGQTNYTLTFATTGAEMAMPLSVRIGDTWWLAPRRMDDLPVIPAGRPTYYAMGDARTLQVYPASEMGTTDTMTVLVAVTINVNRAVALTIPYVVQPHFEVLREGVLSRLYKMGDKPWSSLVRAGDAAALYERGCSMVRNALTVGRAYGGRTRVFNRFGV